jgi:sugar (pentulose or hexulose) kinase
MPFWSALPGLIGGAIGMRTLYTAGGVATNPTWRQFTASSFKSPLIQGGGFGVGYTGGAYTGYGVSNTIDPLGVHKPKYSRSQGSLGLPYGSYGRRQYSRFRSRYSGYTRYPRRTYYRRRRPYYSRRSYY